MKIIIPAIISLLIITGILIFLISIPILIIKISKDKKNQKNYKTYEQNTKPQVQASQNYYTQQTKILNPYLPKKYIFTNNEFACYKNMKVVADKYGLEIFCKVRFADLIETRQSKDFHKWFNKVKSKHIDFVLLDGKTMIPKLLIELDDSTHEREDRKKRDQFVDAVCAMCGLKIRHIREYQVEYIEKILYEEKIINQSINAASAAQ